MNVSVARKSPNSSRVAADRPAAAGVAPPGPKSPQAAPQRQAWPADRVERRPVVSLVPYARNARTHSDAQVAQIAGSIREWGWTMPVLVDEAGGLIAGHARLLAAHQSVVAGRLF